MVVCGISFSCSGFCGLGIFGSAWRDLRQTSSEELKFCQRFDRLPMCILYTFVQGGMCVFHDPRSATGLRVVDMDHRPMVPAAIITWLVLWRHLVVPNPSASDTGSAADQSPCAALNIKRSVSPNDSDAYFLFKILLVTFTVRSTAGRRFFSARLRGRRARQRR
jgi:hypothetical protein